MSKLVGKFVAGEDDRLETDHLDVEVVFISQTQAPLHAITHFVLFFDQVDYGLTVVVLQVATLEVNQLDSRAMVHTSTQFCEALSFVYIATVNDELAENTGCSEAFAQCRKGFRPHEDSRQLKYLQLVRSHHVRFHFSEDAHIIKHRQTYFGDLQSDKRRSLYLH